MNNELIGIISNESELKGVIEDNSFNVKVQITESGPRGKSAYETWLDLGNEGTEEDFMAYLRDVDFGLINYEEIDKKPSIESVELLGDKTFNDFGLLPMTLEEIENLL